MGSLRPILLSNSMIAERYRAGISISTLALQCKCSPGMIRRILETQQVAIRSQTQANRLAKEDMRQRKARIRARLGLS